MADYKTHTYPKHTVYCSCQDPLHSEMVHIGEHGTYQCKMCGHEVQFWRSIGWCNDHPDQEDQKMEQDGMEYKCNICGKKVVHLVQVVKVISYTWSSDMHTDQVELFKDESGAECNRNNRNRAFSHSTTKHMAEHEQTKQEQERALKGNAKHETKGESNE